MNFCEILNHHKNEFSPVIRVAAGQKIATINLSPTNPELLPEVFESTETFCNYIDQKRADANAYYLVGGYGERREIYRRSELFDDNLHATTIEEPRNIHLGIDVWAPAGTPVYCPVKGLVHSYAFNDHFGDYGGTIILQHNLQGKTFFTLYGHLALKDLDDILTGQQIQQGQAFAHFGPPAENGHWPPHLHFQAIENLQGMQGDYPGVCKTSEKQFYLENCADPAPLLGIYPTST